MKSLLSLVIFCSLSIAVAQAQEEADFRMCTEIFLDPPETDDLSNLPPGMVARAVAFKPELGKYWTNGKTLRVGFISGSETARSRVRKYAQEWSQVANIQFLFVEKGETDLRVSFVPGLGSWSMIGTDASRIPQYKQTINFGWFGPIPESEYRANVLHEFGHALGLLHEHQHPQGGIPWDKNKLYAYYRRTQGWEPSTVDQQVLTTYARNRTQYTQYDPNSIMHYPIPNSLTLGDFEVGMNLDLSATDRSFMSKVYPKKATSTSNRPIATTTTRPTAPQTGATKPTRPTTTTTPNRPSTTSAPAVATLTIRDMLPASQKREQVWVTVQGITRTFVLDQSTTQSGKITFTLPKDGSYPYEVRTKTTFLRRVNGRIQETTLNGYGEGELMVRRAAVFDLAIGKALSDHWFEVDLLATKAPSGY